MKSVIAGAFAVLVAAATLPAAADPNPIVNQVIREQAVQNQMNTQLQVEAQQLQIEQQQAQANLAQQMQQQFINQTVSADAKRTAIDPPARAPQRALIEISSSPSVISLICQPSVLP